MIVYFKTRKLEKICNNGTEAVKQLGSKNGKKLQQRLMEFRAAETLEDISRLPPARCHELIDNREGQLSVDIEHPYRLLFIPAHDPLPERSAGGLDWAAVTEIEIIEIADTHGRK